MYNCITNGNPLPREDTLTHISRRDTDWAGIAFSTAAGLGAGLLAGLILSELLGSLDAERVRRTLRQWRGASDAAAALDPAELQEAVRSALDDDPLARQLAVTARALDAGLVELTGAAPDTETRQRVERLARAVAGVDVVVNRILVEGRDLPLRETAPGGAG